MLYVVSSSGDAIPCRYNAAFLNRLVFENLRYRPVRTVLSVLAIGVEVTMILTLVGISYGTLDETARRARGVGADIVVQPPVTFGVDQPQFFSYASRFAESPTALKTRCNFAYSALACFRMGCRGWRLSRRRGTSNGLSYFGSSIFCTTSANLWCERRESNKKCVFILLLELSLDERVKSRMQAYLRAGRSGVRGQALTGSRLSQNHRSGTIGTKIGVKKAELLGSSALEGISM